MSKAFLIVLLILVVLFLLLYPFLGALIKDKRELADIKLAQKFPFFFKTISNGLFEGLGQIHEFDDDPRSLNMMSSDPARQNLIVHFLYSTGHMIMEVGYKYFQQEMRFQYTAKNIRDGSVFTQKDLAAEFVAVTQQKIREHQNKVTQLLNPEQIVKHDVGEKSYDDEDSISMIEHSFAGLTEVQKEAVICVGYLIATANGDPDSVFTTNPVVQQELRFFNIAWENCKRRLHAEGEDSVLSRLVGLDESSFVKLEPFFSAMIISLETNSPDDEKIEKLIHCMEAIGISESKYEEIATKNRLIMQMFSGKQ